MIDVVARVVVAMLPLVAIGVIAGTVAGFIEHILACTRPLPGPDLPWERCSTPCSWCDHMDQLDCEAHAEERSRARGAYRTAPEDWTSAVLGPTANLQQGPEVICLQLTVTEAEFREIILSLMQRDVITVKQAHELIARVSGDAA